jgi:putative ABC transport system permease protein
MAKLLLITRLATRDLRHRPAETVLLLVAIVAATATMTLGLVLHGVTSSPYQQTRAATAGPDVVASPGAGLVGAPGAPALTGTDIALVVAAALVLATLATVVPAARAARTSTVAAWPTGPGHPGDGPA